MIYKVEENYKCEDLFFIKGEIFEGRQKYHDIVQSLSKTGTKKETGFRIPAEYTKALTKTWEEAIEKYPEYFL